MADKKPSPSKKTKTATNKKQKPIELYYWPTPNGWKVSIMLEECGLPYTLNRLILAGRPVQAQFFENCAK